MDKKEVKKLEHGNELKLINMSDVDVTELKSIKQLEDAVRILGENIKSLLDEKMISEKEFIKIKTELERKYKIKRGLISS